MAPCLTGLLDSGESIFRDRVMFVWIIMLGLCVKVDHASTQLEEPGESFQN